MSEIDTSAAAIDRIKHRVRYSGWGDFSPEGNATTEIWHLVVADFECLLAALAERDERIRELESQLVTEVARAKVDTQQECDKWAWEVLPATERDAAPLSPYQAIGFCMKRLAAHDACLTQVREEMPEVKELYERRDMQGVLYSHHPCGDSDSSYQICANCRQQWPCDDSLIDKVVDYAIEAQQNAARWRNERDVWEAERKRLKEEHRKRVDGLHAECERWHQRLSAAEAACAEMREALELAIKEDWKGLSVPLSVNAKVFHALAAQPKQQSVGIDASGKPCTHYRVCLTMSDLQKYHVKGELIPVDPRYIRLIEVCMSEDVDAARAADKATIARQAQHIINAEFEKLELQERLARSEVNLTKYGKHLLSCDKVRKSDFYDCTCGLESVLAAADGKQQCDQCDDPECPVNQQDGDES